MKKALIGAFHLFFSVLTFCQMRYEDLVSLTTICKKEDPAAVQKFLEIKGYKVEVFNTNYDNGTHFVLYSIKASVKNNDDILNKIEIDYEEYDTYKKLSLFQKITTDKEYRITPIRTDPFLYWAGEPWTTILVSKNTKGGEQCLGKRNYNFGTEDTSLRRIDYKEVRTLFNQQGFENNNSGYNCYFVNSNPLIGELRYNVINYKSFQGYHDCSILMWKKFLKKSMVINNKIKKIEIPLSRNGSAFTVNLKFGTIIKKYIIDSGASDMSIDNETYNYFESSNQLNISNRLADSKYRLADGSLIQLRRIRVPFVSIGGVELKSIVATIVDNDKPLLLGKSFLDNFKSWKIDNEKQVLVIELF